MTLTASTHNVGDNQLLGLGLVATAAIVSSTNGLLVRHVDSASTWQVVFYRAIFLVTGVSIVFAVRHWRNVVRALRAGVPAVLLVGPLQGLSSICFVFAITHTTVANTMLVLSAVPLLTSLISWIVLKQRPGRVTIAAMIVVGAGMALMSIDGVKNGNLAGTGLALLNAFGYASYLVLLRRFNHLDMLPAIAIGGVAAALMSAAFVGDLAVTGHDLVICFTWGALTQNAALVLVNIGMRHVRPTELSLLGTIENALAPIWVWLWIGEVPTAIAASGGAIITATVIVWTLITSRSGGGKRTPVEQGVH